MCVYVCSVFVTACLSVHARETVVFSATFRPHKHEHRHKDIDAVTSHLNQQYFFVFQVAVGLCEAHRWSPAIDRTSSPSCTDMGPGPFAKNYKNSANESPLSTKRKSKRRHSATPR
jgi:hypothetical protein